MGKAAVSVSFKQFDGQNAENIGAGGVPHGVSENVSDEDAIALL